MNQHTKHKLADKLRQRKDTGVDTSPHLIVEARAGTGKTTTGIEGLRIILEGASDLIPSSQQLAIWGVMAQSKGLAQTVGFVAFSKAIAVELISRVPVGCQAMTMHSLGLKAVCRVYHGIGINKGRVQDIIADLLGKDIWELRRNRPTLLKATQALVSLCKMNLVTADNNTLVGDGTLNPVLAELAAHYDVDLNGESREVFDLVPRVLERCKEVEKDNCVDFDDMIWLPIALDLPVQKFDLLCVDEAQDLNRCQQALAIKAGRRIILFGDPRQAIYGFAGADSQSMERMQKILVKQETVTTTGSFAPGGIKAGNYIVGRGCVTLPLTVTRRCGRAIVEEAKKIVPDFEAHESCGEAQIFHAALDDRRYATTQGGSGTGSVCSGSYRENVEDGDMILCRVNAPLVSECFKFLKSGRKANIQGRDVGAGLISTIKCIKAKHLGHFLIELDRWHVKSQEKENAKPHPSEGRLIALQDRVGCIYCFAEGALTIETIIDRIETIFTDDKNGCGIMLSSIHKAKGLEAERVFLLEPEGATVPHPMAKSAWQREQEWNLRYVAITRAISELIYVS